MSAITRQSADLPSLILHHLLAAPNRTTAGAIRHDALFDIFPETYWARFTALERVMLRCCLRRPATLRLIRRRADGVGDETVLSQIAGPVGETVLTAPLTDDASDHYLLLEVVPTGPHDDPLVSATWEAPQARERTPRVGVVITTYNREPFLVANLGRLHGRMAGGCAIVVNHGAPGLEARLRDRLPHDSVVRWIDQENSGGAGGFTRGMLEHRAAADVTHLLLMDDDIDLPEDLIERATAVLSFTRPEVCLGGAMFDYHHRTRLFSAGDILIPGSFGIGHIVPPGGGDIALTSGVDFLARVHRPDFNGWWCFAFPIEALDRVGLPMPCFIRGDDVEFGYRLKQAGMPTLGWPGLAVWHMPFADKSAPWHMFYDRRNSLFTNARHRRVSRLAAVGKLLGGFTHHLLRYDYDRVRAMTLGIAAFNEGAAAMALWTHIDHAELIAATSKMQRPDTETGELPPTASMPRLEPKRLSGAARELRMIGRLLMDLFGLPNGAASPSKLPPGAVWRPDYTLRPAVVIERDSEGRPARIYRRDPVESRRAMISCAKALFGMIFRFRQNVPSNSPDIGINARQGFRHLTKCNLDAAGAK